MGMLCGGWGATESETERKVKGRESHVEQLVGRVSRTNVEFATERADGDGVLVQDQQVVAEAAVHVAHPVHSRGQEAREKGDEHTGFDRLVLYSQIILA